MSQSKSKALGFAEIFIVIILSIFYLEFGRHYDMVPRIVTKILPILIIAVSLVGGLKSTNDRNLYLLPVAALLFSAFGDAFGEMKGTGLGIAALGLQIIFFAIAQAIYCISFLRFFSLKGRERRQIYDVLAICVLALFVWFAIRVMPHFDHRIAPVAIVYFILILFMALSAMMQKRPRHWTFAAGAILFFLSDAAIAYGLCIETFPYRGLFVMSTYYAAQLLLNVSLFKPHHKHE